MKVSDLIEALQNLPPDALVLVDGFDSHEFDYAAAPQLECVVPVKPTSHGPSFVAEASAQRPYNTVLGGVIKAVYIGIGDMPANHATIDSTPA